MRAQYKSRVVPLVRAGSRIRELPGSSLNEIAVPVPGGTKRTPVKHEPPLERKKDFREVYKGRTPQEAVAEAGRCLRCYRVVTCAYKKQAVRETAG